MLSAVRGMIWGATIGMALGAVMGGKFAPDGEGHNYLEVGTLHKYGIGYAAGSTDAGTPVSFVDSGWSAGTGAEVVARHAAGVGGTLSAADVAGNVNDFINLRNVGADMGFITTKIPGTLFAVDVSRIAVAFAQNGLASGLVSASIGADAAGFSYAQQVLLGLKAIPLLGNILTELDSWGALDSSKNAFNNFYGSSDAHA
jgi:hypothetical protein